MISVDLSGKVALVTGGGRGLGRHMAQAFAENGAAVAIASRALDSCVRAADEIERSTGAPTLAAACHVGKWNEIEQLYELVMARFGRIDILVNNAGVAPLYPSLSECSEDLFDKVLAVNLKGPFRLAVLVGEQMRAADGGSIINMSSLASQRPTAIDLPYAAAKAGLNSLTAGLAVALGPRVRVNAMLVGPFTTDISAAWDVEGFQRYAAERYPLGRLGIPQEIVGTALYLASEASSFTTGALIPVDGGIGVSSPFPSD